MDNLAALMTNNPCLHICCLFGTTLTLHELGPPSRLAQLAPLLNLQIDNLKRLVVGADASIVTNMRLGMGILRGFTAPCSLVSLAVWKRR